MRIQAQTGGASQSGSPAVVKKLTVSLDSTGLAKTTKTTVVSKSLNHSDEPPFMNGEPEHLRLVFENDKLSDYSAYLQRQLLVYPVQPYASLFHGKEKAAFDKTISTLKKMLATKSDSQVRALPILPAAEGYEVFHNQTKYLRFTQGKGVAFLTCYAQEDAPIKNGDFFYTFQGLTDDGKYYLSFFCPVQVKDLAPNGSSKKSALYLSQLPRTAFNPSLDTLDHMLKSIVLK